ncbi:MAG: tRNA (guanosine(46)-N7)-methyltransferase TrmB [Planctomycetes bacterium]|nr:tRNA (guanosine(46)-N7)-methyltransferase TrmB [Planctomycetota bacterium]
MLSSTLPEVMAKALSELILDHLVPWERLPWPLDLETIFGRRAPLTIEIGFGDGAFLLDQAAKRPEEDFLAIELAWGQVDRLLPRLERAGLGNVRLINGDAALVLERMIESGSVARFVINHPDPWPKERHHHRRLIQAELLTELARALEPDGMVEIATDHADYAAWIGERLEARTDLISDLEATEVGELPDRLVTRYQMKARQVGIGNHFFVWRKVGPTAAPVQPERFEDMPNVAFRGEVDMTRLLADFQPSSVHERHRNVDLVINFVRAFRQVDQAQWLVEALVKEGRFHQQVGLSVLGLEPGRCTVKASSIGYPRPTQGLKRAVWHLARLVQARCPSLEVDTSTVGPLED